MGGIERWVLFFFILCVAGCVKDSSFKPVSIQLSADPISLDPLLAEDGASLKVLANTWEGLTASNAEGNPVLRLARTLEHSADGKTWTAELRTDAKWSDGVPIEADHFVLGFQRARDPRTASKLASFLEPVESVEALDRTHLRYRLKRATAYFPGLLAFSAFVPQRADVLRKNGGRWPLLGPSTGSYCLAEAKTDSRYLLKRNPHSPFQGKLAEVEFLVVKDESAALSLFERGRLSIVSRVADTEWKRIEARGLLHVDPFLATYYLAFRADRPPFDRKEARCRVAGAMDRVGVLRALGTPERPAGGFVPPELGGESSVWAPETGKSLVSGFSGEITLGIDASARNRLIAEKIQKDLKDRLGLALKIDVLDWKSHVARLRMDPPAMFRFGWLSPIRDALVHLKIFRKGDPNALSRWSNAKYSKLVEEIEGLPEGEERARKIKEADRLLVREECAVVPLFHYIQSHGVASTITGFRANPFGVIRIEEIGN